MADRYLQEAERNARRAVELEPDNADYLDTLVAVLEAAGKPEEAAVFRSRLERATGAGSPGGDAPED
jgi:hypothetical protein